MPTNPRIRAIVDDFVSKLEALIQEQAVAAIIKALGPQNPTSSEPAARMVRPVYGVKRRDKSKKVTRAEPAPTTGIVQIKASDIRSKPTKSTKPVTAAKAAEPRRRHSCMERCTHTDCGKGFCTRKEDHRTPHYCRMCHRDFATT